jgi:hypothetical protein
MQLSLASSYFIPLMPKYLLQHPILETPSLCPTLSVRDQASHPYKTTATIIVLYILDRMAGLLKQQNLKAHRNLHRAGYCSGDALLASSRDARFNTRQRHRPF